MGLIGDTMPINGEEVDEHLRNLLAKKGIDLTPSALEKMKVVVFLSHTTPPKIVVVVL